MVGDCAALGRDGCAGCGQAPRQVIAPDDLRIHDAPGGIAGQAVGRLLCGFQLGVLGIALVRGRGVAMAVATPGAGQAEQQQEQQAAQAQDKLGGGLGEVEGDHRAASVGLGSPQWGHVNVPEE